jgi:hypothetical protein
MRTADGNTIPSDHSFFYKYFEILRHVKFLPLESNRRTSTHSGRVRPNIAGGLSEKPFENSLPSGPEDYSDRYNGLLCIVLDHVTADEGKTVP